MAKAKPIDPIFKALETALSARPDKWYIYINKDEFTFSRRLADKTLIEFYQGHNYENTDFKFTLIKVDNVNYSIMDYSSTTRLRGITPFESHFKDKDLLLAKIIHDPNVAAQEISEYCDIAERELFQYYKVKVNERVEFSIDCLDISAFDEIEKYFTENCKLEYTKEVDNNFDTEKLKNGDVGYLRYKYTFEQVSFDTYLEICYTQKDGFTVRSTFKKLDLYVVDNLQQKDIVQHAQRAINIMIEVAKGAMS